MGSEQTDRLTDELRQKVLASLAAGKGNASASRESSHLKPSPLSNAEYFAPVAAHLRSFGERFGVMVARTPSFFSTARSRRLTACIGKSRVMLDAPDTGGWLILEARQEKSPDTNGRGPDARPNASLWGSYRSPLGRSDWMEWPLVRNGKVVQEGAVDAATEWLLAHMGEFVVGVYPTGVTARDGMGPGTEHEKKLYATFSAACSRMQARLPRYREEVALDRATFGKVMSFLAQSADSMGLRVDNPSDSLWKRTVTLGEQARGCDRSIRLEKGQPGKNYQVLFLELQRPGFEDASGLTRGPLLRGGVYGPGHRNGFSAKQWNIPDINSPDFRAVLQDVARWFFSEIGPFIANPKALKGAATEGLSR